MTSHPRLSVQDAEATSAAFRDAALDPHLLRRFRTAFFKKGETGEAALSQLPGEGRAFLDSRIDFHALALESRFDSELDGATKLVFSTRSGHRLETVILRIGTGRTTLCLSSQVGCAAACRFCATGRMGIARDLTAPEILDQVIQANLVLAAEKRRARNIVFMGMGEPFHNEDAVLAAIESLVSPAIFDHAASRILVSTVGVPDAMLRAAERFPDAGLALSLHAARQEVRETIVPLGRRCEVAVLRETVSRLNELQRRPVMVECVLLEGVNDSSEDVDALIEWCSGLRVHVNLIPYNPIADVPELAPTPPPRRLEIGRALKARGLPVTMRYSLGRDIEAACGQLVRSDARPKRSARERDPRRSAG